MPKAFWRCSTSARIATSPRCSWTSPTTSPIRACGPQRGLPLHTRCCASSKRYGLWRCRTWAEWVAAVSGTCCCRLEVRELFRRVTLLRCGVLVVNVAVVLYMVYIILANRREHKRAACS